MKLYRMKSNGHRDDDLVHADAAAGRLADDFARALQHAARVDHKKTDREGDVDGAHPRGRTGLR